MEAFGTSETGMFYISMTLGHPYTRNGFLNLSGQVLGKRKDLYSMMEKSGLGLSCNAHKKKMQEYEKPICARVLFVVAHKRALNLTFRKQPEKCSGLTDILSELRRS